MSDKRCEKLVENGKAICGVILECHIHDRQNNTEESRKKKIKRVQEIWNKALKARNIKTWEL